MKHPLRTFALIAGISGLAACAGSHQPTEVGLNDFLSLNGAKVEVTAEGGIAALSTVDRIDHDTRAYMHVMRHICSTTCQAPLDSASGVLSAAATDSLFGGVLAQKYAFKDDYGTTRNGADMMAYTVRITSGGTTKTIRGDDGTIPGALRQVIDAVRGTITAARK